MSLGLGGKEGEHGDAHAHAGAHSEADVSLKGGKRGGDAEKIIGGDVDA